MERIKTASRIIDLFAPPAAVGRDGFGDLPPDQTQLDASFFNNVQETLAQAIEGQGIALDGLDFDQLTEAINIWSTFVLIGLANGGTFTMTDSSELVVEADGGNGGSTISLRGFLTGFATSTTELQSGATFRTLIGAIVSLLGDVVIGTTSANTLAIESTFTKVILADLGIKGTGLGVGVNFPDGATVAAGTAITGDLTTTVTAGTLDTIDETGVVKPGQIDFYSQTAAPPTTNGVMAWGGNNNLTIGGQGAAARFISIPIEEYLPGPVATVNGIEDTGLEISILLTINDVIYIELDFETENTNTLNDINVRIEVDAVAQGGTNAYRASAANRVQSVRRVVKYTALATAVHVIKGRHGAGAGTTTSTNLRLLVRQANDFA